MRSRTISFAGVALIPALLLVPAAAKPCENLEAMRGDAKNPVFKGIPVDPSLKNPWPDAWEEEFQARARKIIAELDTIKVAAGNTYFENEKRTYGYLMAQALGERGMAAIGDLQGEDAQKDEWHRDTQGIDYYAAFTIKHQMRKYFYFGGLLEPDYRKRMFDGAKAWTEKDPLRRSHYAFEKSGPGWGPNVMDSWVDIRSTENLYLMRTTSVYLMAEETGNKATAALYKSHLQNYAKTLYRIGLGEWDSENYHGHSIPPWLNLYDFANDSEVKAVAKACLDWMFTAGAVKYYRGGFNGPTKRDYNHVQPFGGSAPTMLWVMFGGSPAQPEHWESDEVHMITSTYRAPAAVVHLARKDFNKPVTVLASKPPYSATTSYDMEAQPEFLETQHFGHSYQMGSLASGTSAGKTDTNGFKILVYDEELGAVALQAVPGPDPEYVGSPQYEEGKVPAENRVAQAGNLAIWLVKNASSPWLWVIPESVTVSEKAGVTFLECDRTWVAVRPLGTTSFSPDKKLTEVIAGGDKPKFKDHKVLSAKGLGEGNHCGLAIEIGEKETHGSFAEFQKKVLEAELETGKVAEGVVTYKASDGRHLGFHWQDDPHNLGVWLNGRRHDFENHARFLYRAADGGPAPVHSRRGDGTLYVEAGGQAFGCAVDGQGLARFIHGDPKTVRAQHEISQ